MNIITSLTEFLKTCPYPDEKQSYRVDFVLMLQFIKANDIKTACELWTGLNEDIREKLPDNIKKYLIQECEKFPNEMKEVELLKRNGWKLKTDFNYSVE